MQHENQNPDAFLDAKGLSAYMSTRGIRLTPTAAKAWFDRKLVLFQILPNGVRVITIGRLFKHLSEPGEVPPTPSAPKKPPGRRRRNHI
jgi:hypothetical protein